AQCCADGADRHQCPDEVADKVEQVARAPYGSLPDVSLSVDIDRGQRVSEQRRLEPIEIGCRVQHDRDLLERLAPECRHECLPVGEQHGIEYPAGIREDPDDAPLGSTKWYLASDLETGIHLLRALADDELMHTGSVRAAADHVDLGEDL